MPTNPPKSHVASSHHQLIMASPPTIIYSVMLCYLHIIFGIMGAIYDPVSLVMLLFFRQVVDKQTLNAYQLPRHFVGLRVALCRCRCGQRKKSPPCVAFLNECGFTSPNYCFIRRYPLSYRVQYATKRTTNTASNTQETTPPNIHHIAQASLVIMTGQ